MEAFSLYRQLTYRPLETESMRGRYMEKASAVADTWVKLRDDVSGLVTAAVGDKQLADNVEQLDQAVQDVFAFSQRIRFPVKDAEPSVVALRDNAEKLSEYFGTSQDRLLSHGREQMDEKQYNNIRKALGRLSNSTRRLAQQGRELHIALYDPGESLRIVPALNPAALEKDRDSADDAQPWVALPVILYGSDDLLKDYPKSEIFAARTTFGRAAAAYRNRASADRGEETRKAIDKFAATVRTLGESTSKLREKLPLKGHDVELMAYTAYPAPGKTDAEVNYNTIDPFMWSWVIALGAALSFCVAFGVARKPMFWAGIGLMAFCLAWTVYGFYLRVLVTRWAPVTGMYETVIYVPTFITLLGLWFTLLPAVWPGLKRAWRWTAIPFSWEATPSEPEETSDGAPGRRGRDAVAERTSDSESMINWLMLLPRLLLMGVVYWLLAVAPYAAGGRTIVNVLPVTDVGSSVPSGNNLLVWFVGMCVLLPSVWFLPRVVLALLGGVVAVPMTLSAQGQSVMPQVYARKPFALAATLVGFLLYMIAWYAPILERGFNPLQPVLRDNFWLTIHVLTIVSSYGAGGLAWGLGNIAMGFYLLGKYRPPMYMHLAPAGLSRDELRPADSVEEAAAFRPRPPEATATLANYIYKVTQVAVLLLAAGTILGGLWADVSWGRFWGWDPKEVWALISLLTYLAILHGRYAGWFGNFGLAVGSVFGASAIAFSWYGVNFVLGAGLHSYGFGEGGQAEVFSGIALNWVFVGAAALRYMLQMKSAAPVEPATVRGHGVST
jgi:ABC-type transport system involved in cytochrome c biogenesis permease subunit